MQYVLWLAYFDVSPPVALAKLRQQLWTQLHFPFHVALILLLEGSQILALTLDSTLKVKSLADTLSWVCDNHNDDDDEPSVSVLRDAVANLEIDYNRGATNEKLAITHILDDLSEGPLCPSDDGTWYTLDGRRADDLMGNVTAALFQSRGIVPSRVKDISVLPHDEVLRLYMKLLEFVYVYYMAVGAVTMFLLAAFALLAQRHHGRRLYEAVGVGFRVMLGVFLATLISFTGHLSLAYSFMTSPTILYAFTFILLPGM